MPRFYFRVTHEQPDYDDDVGVDLPDRAAAWAMATRACGEMIAEIDGELPLGTDWKMEVLDESGPVFEITFGARECRAVESGEANGAGKTKPPGEGDPGGSETYS